MWDSGAKLSCLLRLQRACCIFSRVYSHRQVVCHAVNSQTRCFAMGFSNAWLVQVKHCMRLSWYPSERSNSGKIETRSPTHAVGQMRRQLDGKEVKEVQKVDIN